MVRTTGQTIAPLVQFRRDVLFLGFQDLLLCLAGRRTYSRTSAIITLTLSCLDFRPQYDHSHVLVPQTPRFRTLQPLKILIPILPLPSNQRGSIPLSHTLARDAGHRQTQCTCETRPRSERVSLFCYPIPPPVLPCELVQRMIASYDNLRFWGWARSFPFLPFVTILETLRTFMDWKCAPAPAMK